MARQSLKNDENVLSPSPLPRIMHMVRLVRVQKGIGGIPSVVALFYSEGKAMEYAKAYNAAEKMGPEWHYIVDCFRIEDARHQS